jgi:hypothetical protein
VAGRHVDRAIDATTAGAAATKGQHVRKEDIMKLTLAFIRRAGMAAAASAVTALACAAALAGCQLDSAAAAVSEDTQAIAQELSDPGSGITQEIGDLGGALVGSTGVKGPGSAYARFVSGDLSNFTWNPSTSAYERTRSDFDVTLAKGTVHVETLFVQLRFYTSADGSGTPVQPTIGATLDPSIHSVRYHRDAQGTTTVPAKGMTAAFTAATDLLVSSVDTSAGTATITGTHTRSFDRSFDTGRTVQGSVGFTLDSMSIQKDPGTGLLSWSGSLSWTYDATVTRANGTQVSRQRSGTAEFSGSETFVVTTDGESTSYTVADGSPA